MIVLSTLVQAIIDVMGMLLSVYSFIVIGRCIISWVNPDPYNPIVRFLNNVTEPVLWRIRKYLPFTYMGGMDFSPIALLVLIYFTKSIVHGIGYQILALIH